MSCPLTDHEASILYRATTRGVHWWPIAKVGRMWDVEGLGFPLFRTRSEAREQFERWVSLKLEQWGEFRREHPNAILTAAGVRCP